MKQLRNTRYNDRPVSFYGGMVDLPLFVTREKEKSWFADRQALLDGGLWAERETQNRGETERKMRELRDNLHTKRSRDGKAVGGSQERALPRRLQQPAA